MSVKHTPRGKKKIPIAPLRKRVFGILALLTPIFFFVLLEYSLRLFDYGSDLPIFVVETVNGVQYYTLNPVLKNRYFNGINFVPAPSPELFLVSKPARTFRIFCLGESTTIGYPYWYNGSFPSFLRDRLRAIFPDRSIEVVNLGITATNSYTVLDITRDLMDYEPDLLIVYDGHNEFYGMLGAASNFRIASARWITMLYLGVVRLRTVQLIRNAIDYMIAVPGKRQIGGEDRTTLMEQVARGKNIPYNSSLYNSGLTVFRENLEEISDLCRNRGVPLLLGTQVSNIRDQSPFISGNSPGLSERQRDDFHRTFRMGREFQTEGKLDSAVIRFRSCISLDSLYAEAHYLLAQCLELKGKKVDAYPEYMRARNYDELRFRTDSKFNALIRAMEDHKLVFVADIEAAFMSHSRDSLVGNNLILEHLHPNSLGNFYIAEEYAHLMRLHGLLASSDEWSRRDTVSDDYLWANRHVTDMDEILAARKTENLTSGWPFRIAAAAVAPVEERDTLRFLAEQLARGQTTWANAHGRAISYYLQRGDTVEAEKENETIIDQYPLDVASYLRLAQICFNRKEFVKAETILLASLKVEPVPITYRMIGDTYLKEGRPEKAVSCYEELNKFPASPAMAAENAYMLSVAYLLSSRTGPAVKVLEQIIHRYPAYRPARELLAKILSTEKVSPRK